jgi:HrpA-like RNA helicase
VFGEGISGYEVGDGKKDENNRLLYVTDGLLKMKALFKMEILDKIDVLMIDEIHERSGNIDMLLLILHLYYKFAKRKLKLVLCSATIDTKIGKLLEDSGLKVDTFTVETNRHKVAEFPIVENTIIDKIL